MDPERMRAAVADYVTALHRSYLAQADMFPPAVRGAMPLLAGGQPEGSKLHVAAVGARNLHLLATREGLGPLRGQEVACRRVAAGAGVDPAVLRPGGHARLGPDLRVRAGPRTPRCGARSA